MDVALNHVNQLLLAHEPPTVVALALQNAPEALHRSIVDAVRHAGHTLRHTCLFKLVVEDPVSILVASVAVEQRMRVGIGFQGLVEGFEHQRIVVTLTDNVGDDAPIIQIQDGAEVEFAYLNAFVPLELCDIGEPLLVGLVRIELAVEYVLSDVLWILRPPGATVATVLDGRLDTSGTANTENALVIDMNIMIMSQNVVDAPIALLWGFHVDLLHLLSKHFILCRSGAQLAGCPLVIRRA